MYILDIDLSDGSLEVADVRVRLTNTALLLLYYCFTDLSDGSLEVVDLCFTAAFATALLLLLLLLYYCFAHVDLSDGSFEVVDVRVRLTNTALLQLYYSFTTALQTSVTVASR
jgi:hypothetical protein